MIHQPVRFRDVTEMFLPVLQTSVVQGTGGWPFLFDIIIFEAGSKFWVGVDKNA